MVCRIVTCAGKEPRRPIRRMLPSVCHACFCSFLSVQSRDRKRPVIHKCFRYSHARSAAPTGFSAYFLLFICRFSTVVFSQTLHSKVLLLSSQLCLVLLQCVCSVTKWQKFSTLVCTLEKFLGFLGVGAKFNLAFYIPVHPLTLLALTALNELRSYYKTSFLADCT